MVDGVTRSNSRASVLGPEKLEVLLHLFPDFNHPRIEVSWPLFTELQV